MSLQVELMLNYAMKEIKNVVKEDITHQKSRMIIYLTLRESITLTLCSDLMQEVSSFGLLFIGILFILPDKIFIEWTSENICFFGQKKKHMLLIRSWKYIELIHISKIN